MSGRIELLPSAIVLISAVAVATDLARGRIYNWLTLPALLAGLVFSATTAGLTGLLAALAGAAVALLAYGWMFLLRFMGGGDVKLLMAIGAWCGSLGFPEGPQATLKTALLSVLLGGVMAFFQLLFKGRIVEFYRKVHRSVLSLVVKELEPVFPQVDRKLTMPFGIPIAAAACWVVLDDPFAKWGLPWLS